MIDDTHDEPSKDVQALINNGLDFLEKARQELDGSEPKFSIVSFWTAVEILLKVPLAHEHWTLVCSGKKIVRSKYKCGDFQSVTYDETCARLAEVLESPLPPETIEKFNKIRNHRNRVVHFFHSSFTDSDQKQILTEQADAWFALNRLMRDSWYYLFEGVLDSKQALDEGKMLRSSKFYSDAKFRYIKPQLKKLIDNGCVIHNCYHCNKKAAVEIIINEESVNPLYEVSCDVCGRRADIYIYATCPECQSRQRIEDDGEADFICRSCNHEESRYDLLDEWDGRHDEYSESGLPASCSDCDGYETVCEYGGGYLCTGCLTFHDSIMTCEYCGGGSTSVGHMSSLVGCSFCDGRT